VENEKKGKEMRKVSFDVLMKEVHPDVVEDIRAMIKENSASCLVLFRNMDRGSSSFGNSSVVAVGPTCTYKTIEDCDGKYMCDGKHLRNSSNHKQYPEMWCPVQ
jgi:hypothetical protein